MKILLVYHIYPALFGGTSRVVFQNSKELSNRGHDVDVLTTTAYSNSGKGSENHAHVHVYRFKLLSDKLTKQKIILPGIDYLLWVKNRIRTYDCVHINEYRNPYNIIVQHYAEKYRIPYVVQAHGTIPKSYSKRRLKLIYDLFFGHRLMEGASKLIAVAPTEVQHYTGMGISREKIVTVPNGINLKEYDDLPSRGSFKKKYNIPEGRMILYLGRVHKIKGIDFLVKAYAQLAASQKSACLVIAGPDDGYLNKIRHLVDDLGIENRVFFVGSLYDRNKLAAFVDSDVYVLPSRFEIWGLTVLEAYACGKPVIASRVDGLKDLVVNNVTGLLFDVGDVEQLKNAILYVLANEKWVQNAGLEGRNFVEQNYTSEKVAEKLERLYFDIKNPERQEENEA